MSVPDNSKCECSDPGCPVHPGLSNHCELATTVLYRIDMEDNMGTAMCEACAADAYESELFSDEPLSERYDDEEVQS
jgi:hypothetical protein